MAGLFRGAGTENMFNLESVREVEAPFTLRERTQDLTSTPNVTNSL